MLALGGSDGFDRFEGFDNFDDFDDFHEFQNLEGYESVYGNSPIFFSLSILYSQLGLSPRNLHTSIFTYSRSSLLSYRSVTRKADCTEIRRMTTLFLLNPCLLCPRIKYDIYIHLASLLTSTVASTNC